MMGQVSRSTNLACTWMVEMKREKSIKEGRSNQNRGIEKLREKDCSIKN